MLFAVNQYHLGEIAEALGEPERAMEHYTRTVRWWADCDPELVPFRERAREALARLAGEPRAAERAN